MTEDGPTEGPTELMTKETLDRLLGAVSFGYGMFQLGMSMMPEKILKLIEIFGFQGDRKVGIEALGECFAIRYPFFEY